VALEAKILASASKIWPRPPSFGLDVVVLLQYVIGHFSGKNRVKFRNFVHIFPAIILNRMLLIIIWYFFNNYFFALGLNLSNWPQIHRSGLGLEVLASFNITELHDKNF